MLFLALAPSTAAADYARAHSRACSKTYTRPMFHVAARSALHDLALTGREKTIVKRIVRCQRSARSRRNVRFHWGRYKHHWETRKRVAASPQGIARQLLTRRGWGGQYKCLAGLIWRESRWDMYATNPSSGAYGLPQALPGSKMATHGADWRTSARTQLRWMLDYIAGRYGLPCAALGHSNATGWY